MVPIFGFFVHRNFECQAAKVDAECIVGVASPTEGKGAGGPPFAN